MLGKIFLSIIIVATIIWAILCSIGIIWLIRNFSEYREISKHNDTVFKDVISEHSSIIRDINENISSLKDDVGTLRTYVDDKVLNRIKVEEEMKSNLSGNTLSINKYQEQLRDISAKVTSMTYKVSALETLTKALSNIRNTK